MSADHNRLDALRRLAKDRAATPAEKATARRFAEALATKIGKGPRRGRRKGTGAALPEPPAARWRRQWLVRLETLLRMIAVAGKWLHGVWIISLIVMLLILFFGGDAMRHWANDVYLVRSLGLLAVAFVLMAIGGILAFTIWVLKTWRGERLRPALVFLARHLPWLAMLAACINLSVYLEDRFRWPTWLAGVSAWAVTFAICIPWWRWVSPAIERALLRASQGKLRARVVVAIAVTLLAGGGVWAYGYAR